MQWEGQKEGKWVNAACLDKILLEGVRFGDGEPVAETANLAQDVVVNWNLSGLDILQVDEQRLGPNMEHADRILLGREGRGHWINPQRDSSGGDTKCKGEKW